MDLYIEVGLPMARLRDCFIYVEGLRVGKRFWRGRDCTLQRDLQLSCLRFSKCDDFECLFFSCSCTIGGMLI